MFFIFVLDVFFSKRYVFGILDFAAVPNVYSPETWSVATSAVLSSDSLLASKSKAISFLFCVSRLKTVINSLFGRVSISSTMVVPFRSVQFRSDQIPTPFLDCSYGRRDMTYGYGLDGRFFFFVNFLLLMVVRKRKSWMSIMLGMAWEIGCDDVET